MCHYKHLSIEEREKLYLLHGQGQSFRQIAKALGRSPSTISREYHRGRCWKHPYLPSRAQYRYLTRRKRCGKKRILLNLEYRELVRELIEDRHWSPEQISNRLKRENNALQISWVTIYRAIHAGLFNGPTNGHGFLKKSDRFSRLLRHKGKRRKKNGEESKQGKFYISNHLKDRPEEANNRSEKGHFEADTVIGKRGSDCLVTLVDRFSRLTLAGKLPSKDASAVSRKIIELLSTLPQEIIKSVTPDRGSEFAQYQSVTDALPQVTFYFPPPYSPWERGTNENTNGLIREFLPKGYDMASSTDEEINAFLFLLNTRPRKCLGWLSPYEVFFNQLLHLT